MISGIKNAGRVIREKLTKSFGRAVATGAAALGLVSGIAPAQAAPIVPSGTVFTQTAVSMMTADLKFSGNPMGYSVTTNPNRNNIGFMMQANATYANDFRGSYIPASVGLFSQTFPYTVVQTLPHLYNNSIATVDSGRFQLFSAAAGVGNTSVTSLGSAINETICRGDNNCFEVIRPQQFLYTLNVAPKQSVTLSYKVDTQSDLACDEGCFSNIGAQIFAESVSDGSVTPILAIQDSSTRSGFRLNHFEGQVILSNFGDENKSYNVGLVATAGSYAFSGATFGSNNQIMGIYNQLSPVPEPSTGGMLAAGLAALALGAVSAKRKDGKFTPKCDYAA